MDPNEDLEWERGDNFGLELGNDHEHEPGPLIEMDIEFGFEAKDSSEDKDPPTKINRMIGIRNSDFFHFCTFFYPLYCWKIKFVELFVSLFQGVLLIKKI